MGLPSGIPMELLVPQRISPHINCTLLTYGTRTRNVPFRLFSSTKEAMDRMHSYETLSCNDYYYYYHYYFAWRTGSQLVGFSDISVHEALFLWTVYKKGTLSMQH